MDEATLLDKLRKIEALHAGATTPGEREAARTAADRIRARLAALRAREPDEVLVYSLPDPWKRKVFLALCRRYGLTPFREPRQRASTVQVCAPLTFQRKTLWPEYLALAQELATHLDALTERVVRVALHADVDEAVEVTDPKQLPSS